MKVEISNINNGWVISCSDVKEITDSGPLFFATIREALLWIQVVALKYGK